MLENKHKQKVAFEPRVNHMAIDELYDSEDNIIPSLQAHDSSSDESSDDEYDDDASEAFEADEPAVAKTETGPKYFELCNGTTDHHTWECKRIDSSSIPLDEKRKIKQCRIKYHKQIVEQRKRMGLPPPPTTIFKPS